MAAESISPPHTTVGYKNYPLTWLNRELHVHKAVESIDQSLFFEHSIAGLALDETKFLRPFQVGDMQEFKTPTRNYIVIARNHNPKHDSGDDNIQGHFGDMEGWPKLKWADFEMVVYKKPEVERELTDADIVRKISIEQSHSKKTRRMLIQGRGEEGGPWISAKVQFDLDGQNGFASIAKVQGMAVSWEEESGDIHVQRGITFVPKFDEKQQTLSVDNIQVHQQYGRNATDTDYEERIVPKSIAGMLLRTHIDGNIGIVEVVGSPNIRLPISLDLLKKVKFPTTPRHKALVSTEPAVTQVE
jgi:hypothetical protein